MLIKANQIKHLQERSLHRQEENNQTGSKDQVDTQIGYTSLAPEVGQLSYQTHMYKYFENTRLGHSPGNSEST